MRSVIKFGDLPLVVSFFFVVIFSLFINIGQPFWDFFFRLDENVHKARNNFPVAFFVDECSGASRKAGSSSSSDTVHIFIETVFVRHVVVDNVIETSNVESTSTDVRGNHDLVFSFAEVFKGTITNFLVLVTVHLKSYE